MSDTLKNSKWIITSENTGSRGTLSFNNDTTGTYKPSGGSADPIVWGEFWNNGNCALWVVFKNQIDRNCIRIWGIEMTMQGGKGMGAFGNAPNDTGYVGDNLSIAPAAS